MGGKPQFIKGKKVDKELLRENEKQKIVIIVR